MKTKQLSPYATRPLLHTLSVVSSEINEMQITLHRAYVMSVTQDDKNVKTFTAFQELNDLLLAMDDVKFRVTELIDQLA